MKRKKSSSKKKSVKTKSEDWSSKLVKAVWPQERDFFERPERYRYVRKLIKSDECVFCSAGRAEINDQSLVLARDKDVMVIMNKYPYNTGHLLILPIRHVGDLWDVEDQVAQSISLWQKRCIRILKEALQCDGFNLGLNHGAVAGAGIPGHLHWHMVPRWAGDTNFFPLIAETKALPEKLEQTYARLQPLFARESS